MTSVDFVSHWCDSAGLRNHDIQQVHDMIMKCMEERANDIMGKANISALQHPKLIITQSLLLYLEPDNLVVSGVKHIGATHKRWKWYFI